MKAIAYASMLTLCATLHGCASTGEIPANRRARNAELAETFQQGAIHRAVVTQRVIYPYHFVVDSAKLNALGERDLDVLAGHFKENAGELRLRQIETPESLYKERVEAVLDFLDDRGVDSKSVQIVEDLPAGDGMASNEVLTRFVEMLSTKEEATRRTE